MLQQKVIYLLGLLFIFAITFALYYPSLSFDFVNLDDPAMLISNELVHKISLENLSLIFITGTMGNWVPLTYLTLAIQYSLWGLNPLYYHLINNSLHSINVCLVTVVFFRLLLLLNPKKYYQNKTTLFLSSCIAGLLYGLHPLRVESVAWVIELKDILFLLFYLLSILAYIRYLDQIFHDPLKKKLFFHYPTYWLCLLYFILSGLSKTMAVSLPITLLLIDWCSYRKISFLLLREKIPFICFCMGFSFMTLVVTHGVTGDLLWAGWEMRTINAMAGYGFYLEKTILPLNLAPIYYYEAHIKSYFWLIYITGIAVSILFGCIYLYGNRFVRASLFFYLISLIPVIGLTQAGVQSVADRFSYLPTLIIFLWIAYFLHIFYQTNLTNTAKWCFYLILTFILSIECFATRKQLYIWKNAESLWLHQITTQPHPHSYSAIISIYSNTDLDRAFEYSIEAYSRFPTQIAFLEYATMIAYHKGMTDLTNKLNSMVLNKKPYSITGLRILYLMEKDPILKKTYYKKMIRLNKNILISYPNPVEDLKHVL